MQSFKIEIELTVEYRGVVVQDFCTQMRTW
jgi:hypothetical protein